VMMSSTTRVYANAIMAGGVPLGDG